MNERFLLSQYMKTPWREIVRSGPMWALLAAHQGYNWGFWVFLTMIPNYLSHALNFDIQNVSTTNPQLC